MTTLQEIESAIGQFPLNQRWEIFRRLRVRLWEAWDRQIEADHTAGRLSVLISEVKSEFATGIARPLDEVIGDV